MSTDSSRRPQQGTRLHALPEPDSESLAQSRRLVGLITDQIVQNGGQIPFDRFMELALYAPGLGYYSAGSRKFGEQGDFVTAPETSDLFARCIARQCRQVLEEMGGGDLLEFGAGSGMLAADLLAALDKLDALPRRYLIVEVSPDLRVRQKSLLQQRVPQLLDRVSWLNGFPEPGFRGLVIANELLDAMPVHRFRIESGRILEQYLVLEHERLTTRWGKPSQALQSGVERLWEEGDRWPDDFESELNLRASPWLREMARRLDKGVLLLIDYGYNRAEYYHPQRNRGTLMCHFRHRAHSDPLFCPGLQDITANVDFTGLAEAALDARLQVCGYTTQAYFLFGSGLERLVVDSDPNDVKSHMMLMQGVKRLTLPAEMGERFKVLGLSRGIESQLIGFSLLDMRGRL